MTGSCWYAYSVTRFLLIHLSFLHSPPLCAQAPAKQSTSALSRPCCKALTAQCLSCAEGLELDAYCELHPQTIGCDKSSTKSVNSISDSAPMTKSAVAPASKKSTNETAIKKINAATAKVGIMTTARVSRASLRALVMSESLPCVMLCVVCLRLVPEPSCFS